MNSDLWPIISCVIGVFLVISVGAICRTRGWLSREADQSLAKLTANVLIPCLFLGRILWGQELNLTTAVWLPPVMGFASTAIGFLLGLGFAKVLGPSLGLESDFKQRSFALCVGVCNYGYIPLPLAMEFYPAAVFDLIMHNIGVDMALWSVGILVIAGTAGGAWRRAFLSPPLLSVVLAIGVKQTFSAEAIPGVIRTALVMLGDCTIPMGLLLSGALIIDFLRDARWTGSVPVVTAALGLRQGLFPVLMLLATKFITDNLMIRADANASLAYENLRIVMMLQAAMPAAIFPIVLVRLYGRDTTTALRVVLPTSIAGVLLIPMWLAIGKWWLAV